MYMNEADMSLGENISRNKGLSKRLRTHFSNDSPSANDVATDDPGWLIRYFFPTTVSGMIRQSCS